MNKEIGSKIRKLRELQNMTQSMLAEKAGIAQSTLSYIENGKKLPQFDTLSAICRGLDISILDLLSYDVLKANKKLFEQQSAAGGQTFKLALDALRELYETEKQLMSKKNLKSPTPA